MTKYFIFATIFFCSLLLPLLSILTSNVQKSTTENSAEGSGIIFLTTENLNIVKDFYQNKLKCQLWLDQGSCTIYRYGNLLLGFCEGKKADTNGIITFFFKNKEDVRKAYSKMKNIAKSEPKENKKYRIYHFFAVDPEGRTIEFQCFLHPIDWDFNIY